MHPDAASPPAADPADAAPDDLADRTGLDEELLGTPVRLPGLTDPGVPTVRLDYTHFSVLLRTDRRLAAVTGVGIDGATLMDLDRSGIAWRLDPRLPAGHQVDESVYARNDLDRGHLVRRADAVWGATREEAQRGNVDTFHYTNAAPQAASFNQGKRLWQGLENHLLEHAATWQRRLVVLTGPVLHPDDPTYRGVQIPLRFFKVAAFVDPSPAPDADAPDGQLAATGYVLDQTPQLDDLDTLVARATAAGQPPPLGPFRTFQVPIADIAGLTGLDLEPLVSVDRLSPSVTEHGSWRHLGRLADVRWRSAGPT